MGEKGINVIIVLDRLVVITTISIELTVKTPKMGSKPQF